MCPLVTAIGGERKCRHGSLPPRRWVPPLSCISVKKPPSRISLKNWRKSTKSLVLEGSIRAGELKATCDKRNPHQLIALALAAMFALAGSAATAESSLKDENAKELERLLAVPA